MRLSAVDLACHRGGRDVFAGLSFAVASGEVLTVTGRNGAGKSSLLRTIVGLVRLASALSRPPGRPQTVADGRRKSSILGRIPGYSGC
jgi:heme exporter protein A